MCCRDTDMNYFGSTGDRVQMMFNFQVNQNLFYALASADTRPLMKALKATKPRPATAQWGIFLRNHDELDLGRLTREQRQRCSTPSARTNGCSFMIVASGAARSHARRRSPAHWNSPTA